MTDELITKADIENFRLVFKRDLEKFEHRLVITLGGVMVFTIGIVAVLVKLL
jgi:hypothetical protein